MKEKKQLRATLTDFFFPLNLVSAERHCTPCSKWLPTKAFCAAAAASVSTLSGSLLVSVTFPVFSHHLRCSQELCLTFEVPSGGPSDEQQPVYLTFYESHPHILSAPCLLLPNSPVSWLFQNQGVLCNLLYLPPATAPQRAGWPQQTV